jgi:hypothetical protein
MLETMCERCLSSISLMGDNLSLFTHAKLGLSKNDT